MTSYITSLCKTPDASEYTAGKLEMYFTCLLASTREKRHSILDHEYRKLTILCDPQLYHQSTDKCAATKICTVSNLDMPTKNTAPRKTFVSAFGSSNNCNSPCIAWATTKCQLSQHHRKRTWCPLAPHRRDFITCQVAWLSKSTMQHMVLKNTLHVTTLEQTR